MSKCIKTMIALVPKKSFSYTLHPTPYTLHPTPHTLHPTLLPLL
ncbi:hypothetical protein [Moorena sp. SIO3I6]|nr:hypothetical protein [Moorena sp. SIO3I6]